MNTNQSKRPSDAVIEAARDLAKRLPSGPAESVYHACIELRRLRKAFAELDRQRAETCTARDDTPSKSRTKRIAIQRAKTSEATESSIALAQDWARANAGEHADTIIEALAAYDPERVGARTVAKPAQWHESLRSYMDAWCKIVETLDDIRPAWAESDGESVADCACRTIRELASQAPERRAVTNEDVRRACDAWDRSKMAGANRVAVHMRAALESLAGVPAAQPADEIADLTKLLAAAQRPFDPDVAEVIRKGWDTFFDDAQSSHPTNTASEADARLADTQRAIIEAAEARGYARAKVEGEADARDVVRLAFCIELGTVPEERPDQPKERRWSLTLYPNGWQVLVVHGSTYVECIDAAIEAAKPQRAAQRRK